MRTIRRLVCSLPILLLLFALPVQGQVPLPGPGSLGNLGIWYVHQPAPSLMAQTGASSGAFIDRVIQKSPADQAGLQTADVIVKVDDKSISHAEDIDNLFRFRKVKPGDSVTLHYVRKGTPRSVKVKVLTQAEVFPRMKVPFLAEKVEERTWTENGVRRTHKVKRKYHRDGAGRMAEETFRPKGVSGVMHTVDTFDPVKLVRVSINHYTRKVRIVRHKRKLPADFKFEDSPVNWIQSQASEYLGTKTIQGLRCEGYRLDGVMEVPDVFGISSDEDLSYSIELWFSDLMVYPILNISEDPLKGRTVSKVVDVQVGVEPDTAIFEIPEGYEVEEVELADILTGKKR